MSMIQTEPRFFRSRPTRACELKFPYFLAIATKETSRPTRACELKYEPGQVRKYNYTVTPHAGV